ncbi:MAG: methylmalonyl-CoA mutase small subunit [Propioniciclava sp.]|uniref:methylmalonyl-CoA mutase small subunit n=1 Tax=Propioniciclava sp. TaxID=2038686 RepID=UPI0039E23B33
MTADPEQLTLAGFFPQATDEDWEREVLKVLNRGRPEGKQLDTATGLKRLTNTTLDGIDIAPLYVARDDDGPLGYPGAMPFTRGATVRGGDAIAWDVAQLHEDPDVAATNKAVLTDLERGATSVWFRVDPDALPAGRLADALDGFFADLAPVRVSSNTDQDAAASALVGYWRAAGDAAQVSGNLGIDALAFAALHGTEPDLSSHRRWVAEVAGMPKVTPLTVDVLPYHGAGATDAQELAFAIATGVEYLRDLEDAGIAASEGVKLLEFRVAATADQFATIAKLRALRRLWARVAAECGVGEADRGARTHAVTSPRMMSRVDPHVNMLRCTIATFAAAVGGAEVVTALPFDHAAGLPTPFSRRIARNIQAIAAEESHVGRVQDPAGGSWYVESLTDDLAQAAWALLGEIEASGGMVKALAGGDVAARIDASNAARAKQLATRKIELTGVNMFPLAGEKPFEAKARPEAPVLAGLKQIRDSEVFEGLRNRAWAHEAATGAAPDVLMACLGAQRDFGGRQGFALNVLLVGGINPTQSHGGTPQEIAAKAVEQRQKIVVLASSAAIYAEQAVPVAQALKDAGVEKVYLAGQLREAGDVPEGLFDGTIALGMDVVTYLESVFETLGVAR